MGDRSIDHATERFGVLLDVLREHRDTIDRIVKRATQIDRQLGTGKPWATILEAEQPPLIVELLTESIERLHSASAHFRRAEAHALRAQGFSTQDIANRFGVTRQRVSKLLNTTDVDRADHGAYHRDSG